MIPQPSAVKATERPEFCPTCKRRIGPQEPVVRIGKGVWTCDGCDGKTLNGGEGPGQSVHSETCCSRPQRASVRKEDQHVICLRCLSHDYKGRFYSRKQWDEWLSSTLDEDDSAPVKAEKERSILAEQATGWWKISISGYGDFAFYGTEDQAEEMRRNKARWEQGVGKKVRITEEEAAELP